MEEKRLILKQVGWSDELIDKCLSGSVLSEARAFDAGTFVRVAFDQDVTSLTLSVQAPIISDGTHLIQ